MDDYTDYIPTTDAVEATPTGTYPVAIVACHVLSLIAWMAFAVFDVHKHRGEKSVEIDRLGAVSGKLGVTRTLLGVGRLLMFAFSIFFVLYHLCYENIKNHTDGLEYLSDWTFILMGITFGFLTFYSLTPNALGGKGLANFTRIAHSTTWPTNILSTVGAWYSFLFSPQCVALEGVDNYPWCYLEWYRLSEHGLNMIILGFDWYLGAIPVKRGDFGWTLIFLGVYSVWTMYLQFHTGNCPYVMFDFNSGWLSVPWFNAAFVGVSAAFFLTKKLFDVRDAKTGNGGGGVLPGHVKYDAIEVDTKYEYE